MRRRTALLAVAVVIALGGALALVQMASTRGDSKQPGTDTAYYTELPTQGTSIGEPNALVLVEEYFDYQCPHCHTAADTVVKPLIEKYVARGEVRFSYRMFPILGPESVRAAQASYCAALDDKFWPFYERLIKRRGTGNRGAYSATQLLNDAEAVGLNVSEFTQCLEGEDSLAYVEAWHNRAVELGLRGTPSFVVDGELLPTSSWEAVDGAVARALEERSRTE